MKAASFATAYEGFERLEQRFLLAVDLLDPLTQPKFVNPLPIPGVIQPTKPGGTSYQVSISQFEQQLGLYDLVTGQPMRTTVWGYNGSYPGPTFVATKGTPINVLFDNKLVDRRGKPLPHLLPIDTSVHWAFSHTPYTIAKNGVPVVTHLHGGHVEAASDGGPDQWYTPGFKQTGPTFEKKTFAYVNDQDAATLWYHDHALGITRLNAYAGLAGFYLVRDALDTGTPDNPSTPVNENPLGLPTGMYEVGLAVQDKMFTADGQLFYPTAPPVQGSASPSIMPEMFGDHILVNGKAWPYLDVEPRKYRFRILNGSDSRFYNFALSSGTPFVQIGTEQGLLEAPITIDRLTLGPGERADVVVDFSGLQGQTVIVRNNAKTPFPAGATVDPQTTGQVMAFRVGTTVTTPDVPLATSFTQIDPLVQTGATRKLALFEMTDEFGRLRPQLGTVNDGALLWDDATTETPNLNDVEVWEVYNNTPDAHPIHLHLVKFQVISRQKFGAAVDPVTGKMTNVVLKGTAAAPPAGEAAWKDTVQMMPGEVTRIIAKFDKPGEYVWHCHILSHEDHEMMRRFEVQATQTPADAPTGFATAPSTRASIGSAFKFSDALIATALVQAEGANSLDELLRHATGPSV